MRKKYLSALLFGALLMTSAGTFTSCKDYDDEINDLQGQITANADAIKALQDKINSGKWITELTSIEGGFKVTFSDEQSFEIVNGKDGAAGEAGTKITIGEDGYWYFDDVKSEYKAVADSETSKTKAPYVNEEDGYWYFFNEEGEAVKSDYKAIGASYAVAVNGGYNLYMPDANGEMMDPIFVAGAAAAITSIEAELINSSDEEVIQIKKYAFDTESNKQRWQSLTGKTITSNKIILTSAEKIGVRINPVNVQATGVNFSLTNSKNETLPGVIYKATEYKGYVTSDNVTTRADFGNGLYTLNMKPLEVKDQATVDNTFKLVNGNANILYALNADNACRGKYQFGVLLKTEKAEITNYLIDGDSDNSVSAIDQTSFANNAYSFKDSEYKPKVDAKVAHSISTEDMSEIYDMWLTAEDYDVKLFDLTFDQEKHTFTVNADPDVITKADFVLTVHTINNNGEYHKINITIHVSNKIIADAEYAVREWTIVDDNEDALKSKNAFFADMATMTNSLGNQLAAWQRKVNDASVKYFTDAECQSPVSIPASGSGIDLIFTNANNNNEVAIKDAVNMKFAINNEIASNVFSVDKVYYAQITFTESETASELNTIVVPFKLSIPELSTMFAIRDGYVVDGVINAYFYQAPATDGEAASTAVELERYFSKYVADAYVAVTGKIDNKDCSTLFKWGNTNPDVNNKYQFASNGISTTIELINGINEGKPQNGYGKAVTVKVTKDNYYNWKYVAEGAGEYQFKIRLMSPVYEGSIAVLTGERVIVNANDFVNGANITEKDIEGRDYNNNNLYIFPDAIGTTEHPNAWSNKQIWDVTPNVDKDHYIDSATMKPASTKDGKVTANGVINIKGRSLSKDTDIDLPVKITDAWGYQLDVTVPVTVKVSK